MVIPIEYVLIQLADPLLRPIRPATGNGLSHFSPMILSFCCCMSSIWVSQKYTGNRKHAAAGAVDGVMSAVTVNDDGLVLRLYIQPKASRDSIVGLHGDEVKAPLPRRRLTVARTAIW